MVSRSERLKKTLILIMIGLTACVPTETATPAIQVELTITPTPIQLLTKTLLSTAQPEVTPTNKPTATLRPTYTPLVETQKPGEDLMLTVTICLETFCPPYWLDQESKILLVQPGILDAMAFDEKDILIVYNPEELTEEEVIELFVRLTNLEVEQ